MSRVEKAALPAVMIMVFCASGCFNGPDPWSPKTYPLELRQFKKDTGALPGEWKKYRIKGEEDNSFFFSREDTDEIISVYYTCGKYQDVSLQLLAEHLIIPMGQTPEVITSRYVDGTDEKEYHIVAHGRYQYHKKTKYKKLGVVPDLFAEEMMDAYVVHKRHCVVDVVYIAPPDQYQAGVDDFHAYLRSVKVAVDEEK